MMQNMIAYKTLAYQRKYFSQLSCKLSLNCVVQSETVISLHPAPVAPPTDGGSRGGRPHITPLGWAQAGPVGKGLATR